MSGRLGTALTIAATLSGVGQPVLAQDKPAPIVEAVVGRSGFIDEVWDYFNTIGGGARVFVTPRLAIGPEVAYLSGEFDARAASNLTVTANITFDIVRDDGRRRIVPYLAAGGGYSDRRPLLAADRDPRRACHSRRVKARCRPALAPASLSGRICSSRPSSASDGNRKRASP